MKSEQLICTGSLMDGVSINVLTWCGFHNLSDDEQDILWEATTELDLFESASSCEVIQTGDSDEVPGQSDIYFKIVSADIPKCKSEICREIQKIIGGKSS